MKYDFREVPEDEIRLTFPALEGDRELFSYEAMDPADGRRYALAVFMPSTADTEELIMYHCSVDPESEVAGFARLFFRTCFRRLKRKGFQRIFYKNGGAIEDLGDHYDILTGAGFEPMVILGRLLSYRLFDLLETDFIRQIGEWETVPLLSVSPLTKPLSKEERSFMNTCAEDDIAVSKKMYTPEFSFICVKDPSASGLCCMQRTQKSLMMSIFRIDTEYKRDREAILRSLLFAIVRMAAEKDLPEDTPIQFFFDEMFDIYAAEKMFENQSEILHYQEFVYEL